jgi:hypothetical protein
VNREVLSLALNQTTHALRYVESAARRFMADIEELEAGSWPVRSVGYIQNRLSDARDSLAAAEQEIRRLIDEADFK